MGPRDLRIVATNMPKRVPLAPLVVPIERARVLSAHTRKSIRPIVLLVY